MLKEEAIEILKADELCRCCDTEDEALNKGIKALELIGYLKDRPCEACTFHTENGCSKWKCVFNQVLGIQDI